MDSIQRSVPMTIAQMKGLKDLLESFEPQIQEGLWTADNPPPVDESSEYIALLDRAIATAEADERRYTAACGLL